MPTYTEAQIRAAIKTVITTNAPNAVVFAFWVLGHDPNEWPGVLRPPSGVDVDKVHGYIITRTQTDAVRKNPQCVTRTFIYDIWAFYRYDEASTNTTSSDITFNAELDAISQAFVVASTLPAELQRVTEEPEFRIDLDMFGGELLHHAIGRLTVEQL